MNSKRLIKAFIFLLILIITYPVTFYILDICYSYDRMYGDYAIRDLKEIAEVEKAYYEKNGSYWIKDICGLYISLKDYGNELSVTEEEVIINGCGVPWRDLMPSKESIKYIHDKEGGFLFNSSRRWGYLYVMYANDKEYENKQNFCAIAIPIYRHRNISTYCYMIDKTGMVYRKKTKISELYLEKDQVNISYFNKFTKKGPGWEKFN